LVGRRTFIVSHPWSPCVYTHFPLSYTQTEKLLNDAAAAGTGAVALDEAEVESLVSALSLCFYWPPFSFFFSWLNHSLTLYQHPLSYQVREFASYWKAGIQQINDDVLAYFATCRNGMDILKQVHLPLSCFLR